MNTVNLAPLHAHLLEQLVSRAVCEASTDACHAVIRPVIAFATRIIAAFCASLPVLSRSVSPDSHTLAVMLKRNMRHGCAAAWRQPNSFRSSSTHATCMAAKLLGIDGRTAHVATPHPITREATPINRCELDLNDKCLKDTYDRKIDGI